MAGATPAPQKDCNQKACPTDYNPLCGEENGKHITFGNPCVLGVHNCEKNASKHPFEIGAALGDAEISPRVSIRCLKLFNLIFRTQLLSR